MAFYQSFTTTNQPDPVTLLAVVHLALSDATATIGSTAPMSWVSKKATAWTAPQIAAVQSALDTTAPTTPQVVAQRLIDTMSTYDKARDLALIDQLNVIRAALPTPLGPITPAQAIAAIRAKAGTL